MRHVVKTNEVPHLWAHQTQEDGTNPQRNLYFRGPTIYSYRDSFPIGHIVDRPVGAMGVEEKESVPTQQCVLVTLDTYSNTTARHVSAVRQAIPPSLPTFRVPLQAALGRWKEGVDTEVCLESYRDRLTEQLVKVSRARDKEYASGRLQEMIDEYHSFCVFFGIPHDPASVKLPSPEEMEEIRKQAAKESAKKAQATKVKQARLEKKNAEKIQEWRDWKIHGLPCSISKVYLRVKMDITHVKGDPDLLEPEVETSKGVTFPITHAYKALRFIRVLRAKGEGYQRNGHSIHLGHYVIDRVDKDGMVHAGCHHVAWDEIERIAPQVEEVAREWNRTHPSAVLSMDLDDQPAGQ